MTVVCCLAVLSGHLFVGWTNDLVDARLDAAQGRLDKPLAAGGGIVRQARAAALVSLAACVPLSLATGLGSAAAHFAGIAAGTAYNVGLKRTPVSVLPYAVGFAMIPAFVTLGPPITHPPAAWATAAAALAGAGAHFAQVLPDIERDRRLGVLGLPQRLGAGRSAAAAAALMLAATALVAAGARSLPVLAAVAVSAALMGAVVATAAQGRAAPAFRLVLLDAAVVVVALLLGGARF